MGWGDGDYIRAAGAAAWLASAAPLLHVLPLAVFVLMLRRPGCG